MKIIWGCLLFVFTSMAMHNQSELSEKLKMQLSQKEIIWKTVKDLIDHGACANTVTDDGESALVLAVGDGNAEMVDYLLKHGANGNYINNQKGTAVRFAVIKGNLLITSMLSRAGVDLDIKDSKYNTALMWAAIIRDAQIRAAIVKLLLESGADRTVTDDQNNTAMTVAVGDQEITDLLEKKLKL